jgi:hypothetical protein
MKDKGAADKVVQDDKDEDDKVNYWMNGFYLVLFVIIIGVALIYSLFFATNVEY